MKKYKIAFVVPSPEGTSGISISTGLVVDKMRELGHEVHQFCLDSSLPDTEFLHSINSKKRYTQLKLLRKLYEEEVKKGNFDLVSGHESRSHYLINKLGIKNHLYFFRQPRFVLPRTWRQKLNHRLRFPKVYNNSNMVSLTQCFLDQLQKNFTYLKPKTTRIIHNPIDKNLIEEKIKEPFEKPDYDYIVAAGALREVKNYPMMIRAFKNIENKDIKLVILGKGREEDNLKEYVRELNIEDRVIFAGYHRNPYPWFKNAKLFVHTANAEMMPRAVLESFSVGIPVISTNMLCGASEILTGRFSKYLVTLDDDTNFTLKINEALKNYPKLEKEDIEKFEVDIIANQYLDAIKEFNE